LVMGGGRAAIHDHGSSCANPSSICNLFDSEFEQFQARLAGPCSCSFMCTYRQT
jgi:hypothetical protein